MSISSAARDERLHKKDKPADQRTPGQRDRDRVLYTSALRRLAAITQVVSPTEGSVFHNRLTHTLEVAQIGRRLAEDLCDRDSSLATALGGIDAERVEAAALAHDLGHPPFGHIAEKELDRLVRVAGVADGFESNAQALRIVTKLAVRSEEFPGLNLTRATLNAVLKYPWQRRTSGFRYRKWGVYSTEEDNFKFARKVLSIPEDQKTAEAELMDWADDIAYAVHDLEDFYRAGLIPIGRLVKDEDEKASFLQSAFDALQEDKGYNRPELQQAFEEVIAPFPITERYQGTRRHRAAIRGFTARLIGGYIRGITFAPTSSGHFRTEIVPKYERQVELLKQLTWHYVIRNPALETQQYGQRKVISDLFCIYEDAANSEASKWGIFAPGYREALDKCERREDRTRLVADSIAAMTEQQALKMHQRLTGISPGSVMDIL